MNARPYERLPFEDLFLTWSLALGKPWPGDAWMKCVARSAFSVAQCERLMAEAIARATVIEVYQAELREVVAELDAWIGIAEVYALEAARRHDASPWNARPQWKGDEDDGTQA